MSCENYRVTISGKISSNPSEFAINLISGGKILLHVNPRWTERRTVFNAQDYTGWGYEQYAYFVSLYPNSHFEMTITSSALVYLVKVNNEQPFVFHKRMADPGLRNVRVEISKNTQNDVQISSISINPC